MLDFTTGAVDGSAWVADDLSGLGNDASQSFSWLRPTGANVWDGSTRVDLPISGGTYTIVMSLTKDDSSTSGFLIDDQSPAPAVRYEQGSTIAIVDLVYVDDVLVTTYGELFDALHQAGEVIVRIVGSARPTSPIEFGRGSAAIVGSIRRAVVLNHAALGAALTATVAHALAWVALT